MATEPASYPSSKLLSGHIVQLPNESGLSVIDQKQQHHHIDSRCHLLAQLQPGDSVIFCHLDDGQVAVLHRLVPVDTANQEFSFTLSADTFLRITNQGIQLQAGKASLSISKSGMISLNAKRLQQSATETLTLKGSSIQVN